MEKDPVCGMDVDPAQAAGSSQYNGKTYYFCSPGCKRSFDKNPEQYVGEHAGHDHGGQGEHHGHSM